MPDPRPLQIDTEEPAPQVAIDFAKWMYDFLWDHGVRDNWQSEEQRQELLPIVKAKALEMFGVVLEDSGAFTLRLN